MKKDMFNTKAFRAGGYSVFAAILVIAIAVSVIFITDSLPSKFTKLDMTKASLFGLSEETKTVVGELDKEVNIYVITRTGASDTLLTNVLANYESLSSKINVEIKDPVVNPTFTDKYTSETVNLNSLVIECGSKSRYIPYEELFDQSVNMDYTTSTSFIGESKITSGIRAVTEYEATALYVVSGHGETVLSESVSDMIANNNIEKYDINLISQSADLSNASCVLIYEPQADFSASEIEVLSKYLENGGNLLVYTGMRSMSLPNLNQLMSTYGISADSKIVLESDLSRSVSEQPYYMLPMFAEHSIVEPLNNSNYYVMAAFAHPIDISDGTDAEVEPLITTSKSAYRVNVLADGTIDSESLTDPEQINLGVAATKGDSHIVWYSATSMLESQVGANTDLFLNSINWMCERESGITIHAKSLDVEYLTVSTSAARVWNVIFIFLIPAAFIAFGIFVWVKRRRK